MTRLKIVASILLVLLLAFSSIAAAAGRTATHVSAKLKKTIKQHRAGKKQKHSAESLHSGGVLDGIPIDSAVTEETELAREINKWSWVRYRKGGSSKKGVDCSGFTSQVYRNALGVELPRTAHEQHEIGDTVDASDLKLGDLLFFHSSKKKKRINHVAIYLGDGRFVHSASRSGVRLDSLSEEYYYNHLAGARRLADPAPGETSVIQSAN